MIDHKEAVGVAEMARMVGLSRQRFYQLIGSTFPPPIYDVLTRRPFFNQELQAVCLEVRKRNCGVDGRPVLFYARHSVVAQPSRRRAKPTGRNSPLHADLIDGLRSLGLIDVSPSMVGDTVRRLYPDGVASEDGGEVLRSVFLSLKRQYSTDNVA